ASTFDMVSSSFMRQNGDRSRSTVTNSVQFCAAFSTHHRLIKARKQSRHISPQLAFVFETNTQTQDHVWARPACRAAKAIDRHRRGKTACPAPRSADCKDFQSVKRFGD